MFLLFSFQSFAGRRAGNVRRSRSSFRFGFRSRFGFGLTLAQCQFCRGFVRDWKTCRLNVIEKCTVCRWMQMWVSDGWDYKRTIREHIEFMWRQYHYLCMHCLFDGRKIVKMGWNCDGRARYCPQTWPTLETPTFCVFWTQANTLRDKTFKWSFNGHSMVIPISSPFFRYFINGPQRS